VPSKRGRGEGTISKRDDGRWVARVDQGYVDGKRKRKYFYGATRKEVAEKLKKGLTDQQQGLPLPSEVETVAAYLERWIEGAGQAKIRASTYDGYKRIITKHVVPSSIGRVRLAKLTALDLANLYQELLKKGMSARYVQYTHAVIHKALHQATGWNMIARNPADFVEAPKPTRKQHRRLTADESRHLLDVARDDPLHALYVLALTGGMRSGELLGLRWSDVDWAGNSLHVRQQVGRTSAGMEFSEPKTAKGRRTITLPSVAIEALHEHRARQVETRLAAKAWEDEDLVFPNATGGPMERQNVQRRSFKPLLKKAELPDIRFHDLRHSAATLLLSLGVHPKVVQERLGHATIAITMDIYSEVMPELQSEAADKLDGLFGTA